MTTGFDMARTKGTAGSAVSSPDAVSTIAEFWQGETSVSLVDANYREQRHGLVRTIAKSAREHQDHYAGRVADAAKENERRGVLALLSELSSEHGVAWSDIAAMLGISVPALRKWRTSASGTTPENHQKLAQLAGFFKVLSEVIDAPAATWMSMKLVDGFNVTPADIYSPASAGLLLDLAAGNAGITAEAVLDKLEPSWREAWASRYEVFEAEDGEMSMRPRLG